MKMTKKTKNNIKEESVKDLIKEEEEKKTHSPSPSPELNSEDSYKKNEELKYEPMGTKKEGVQNR